MHIKVNRKPEPLGRLEFSPLCGFLLFVFACLKNHCSLLVSGFVRFATASSTICTCISRKVPFIVYNNSVVIITRYIIIPQGELWEVKSKEAARCPHCQSIMSGYDRRRRKGINGSGAVHVYQLHRVKCPQCCAVHLLLPDFLQKNKHYTADVISAAVEDPSRCPAEDSTIRRWRNARK